MVAYALASSVSDQSYSHHGNTDINDNDESQEFETPRKIIVVLSVLAIQLLQQPHQIYPNFLHL